MRIAVAVVAALVALGCSGDDRPTVSAWRADWEVTRALVPEASAFPDDAAELCGEFLGELRARREELRPAPSEAVDTAFHDWIEEAESIGLDCRDDTPDLDARLDHLHALADDVDDALGAAG